MPEASLNDRDQYKHGVNLLSQFFTQSLHSRCWLNHSEISDKGTCAASAECSQKSEKTAEQEEGNLSDMVTVCRNQNQPGFGSDVCVGFPPTLSSIEELRKVKHDMDLSSLKFLRHWLCTFHRCQLFSSGNYSVRRYFLRKTVINSFDQKSFSSFSHESG